MKHFNIKTLLVGLALTVTIGGIYSCSKGDKGPAGSQGPVGPQGPQGTANVKVYTWGSKSTDSGTVRQNVAYTIPNERYSQFDSVEWHFYVAQIWPVDNKLYWHSLPGFGVERQDYFALVPLSGNPLTFALERVPQLSADPTKTKPITFNQAKVVIVPGGAFTNLRTSINWEDYNDVKSKLNIRDEDEILVQ